MSEIRIVPADGGATIIPMGGGQTVVPVAPVFSDLDAAGQPAGHVPTALGDDTWTWQAQSGGEQDTGDIDLLHLINDTDWLRSWGGLVSARRIGARVDLSIEVYTRETWEYGDSSVLLILPEGLRPMSLSAYMMTNRAPADGGLMARIGATGGGRIVIYSYDIPRVLGDVWEVNVSYLTGDDWVW